MKKKTYAEWQSDAAASRDLPTHNRLAGELSDRWGEWQVESGYASQTECLDAELCLSRAMGEEWVLPNGVALNLYNTMGTGFRELFEAVTERGREFRPIARPKGVRKHADKACFRNALITSTGDLHYTEGFALKRVSDDLSVWLHHAFLTDDHGHAIEVTLRTPADRYVGVALTRKEAARMVVRNGTAGSAFEPEDCK